MQLSVAYLWRECDKRDLETKGCSASQIERLSEGMIQKFSYFRYRALCWKSPERNDSTTRAMAAQREEMTTQRLKIITQEEEIIAMQREMAAQRQKIIAEKEQKWPRKRGEFNRLKMCWSWRRNLCC